MYNNAVEKTPEMVASEETEILDEIENEISASNTEATANATTVDMKRTGLDFDYTGVRVLFLIPGGTYFHLEYSHAVHVRQGKD